MKITKLRVYIFLTVCVIGFLIILFINKFLFSGNQQIFSIDNTSDITKIVISKEESSKVTIERKDSVWFINSKFNADKTAITLLLQTLSELQMRAPIAKSEHAAIAKELKQSVKVDVYIDENLKKSFYVGKQDKEKLGNYMMLAGSEKPVIVTILGHNNSIAQTFNDNENYWRDKVIFDYQKDEIKEIEIFYPSIPEKSVSLKIHAENKIIVTNFECKPFQKEINYENVSYYLNYFNKISFEKSAEDAIQKSIDSIRKSKPECIIKITDKTGKNKRLYLFPILKTVHAKKEIDVNRTYGIIEGFENVLVIKYFDIDPIYKDADYFLKK